MNIGHIDVNKLSGVGEKGMGLLRELAGMLLGNESMEKAGRAQQDKGGEKLAALRKETEAEKAESKADLAETRQKAAAKSRQAS